MGVDLFVCAYCNEAFTDYQRNICLLEDDFENTKYNYLNYDKYGPFCCRTSMCDECYFAFNGLCIDHIKLFRNNNIKIFDLEKEENIM